MPASAHTRVYGRKGECSGVFRTRELAVGDHRFPEEDTQRLPQKQNLCAKMRVCTRGAGV